MKINPIFIFVSFLSVICASDFVFADNKKIVIAHRGASGYLPEHSMAAKAMAYAMGADYIEQDLVMTKDNKIVVLHDHYLDRVTDVAEVFPDRKRADGRYYVIDFNLDEIRQLEMTESFRVDQGVQVANYPQRFPLWKSSFRIHTFEEEIEMIQGLNKTMGKNIGIYPEIKYPSFHRDEGKDISKAVLHILKKYNYTQTQHLVYLQCFDANELRRIHDELFSEFGMELKLVQLIPEIDWDNIMDTKNINVVPYDYDKIRHRNLMQNIAEYADGVGPWMPNIVKDESTKAKLIVTHFVDEAHLAGLVVHPYTFRADVDRIPSYASDFEELLDIFYYQIGVDGIFTDFPDRAVDFINEKH